MDKKHGTYTEQDWIRLIRECYTSGLNIRDWCRSCQIPPSSFYYQVKKLRDGLFVIPRKSGVSGPMEQEIVPIDFSEIPDFGERSCTTDSVTEQDGSMTELRVIFPECILEIQRGASNAAIRSTIAALRETC